VEPFDTVDDRRWSDIDDDVDDRRWSDIDDNVVQTHRRESKDVSQTEENVAVAFPPKKRRRKSVAFDDSSVTVTPVEMDQVNSVAPVDMDQVNRHCVVSINSVMQWCCRRRLVDHRTVTSYYLDYPMLAPDV